jgi:hypothetical protein
MSTRDSATKRRASRTVMIPTGMLTKNTHRHEAMSVITPPTSRPTAAPPAAIALHTPQRLGAPLAVEGGGHDRQGGRRDERSAQALQRASGDEYARGSRHAVEQGGQGEQDHARHEQALAADEVGGAAAEQQEAAEDEGVAVDHPLEVGGREVQAPLHRRQRDVDHAGVEHDHELGHAGDHEDEPRVDCAVAQADRAVRLRFVSGPGETRGAGAGAGVGHARGHGTAAAR